MEFSLHKFFTSVPELQTIEDFVYHHQPYNITFLTYAKSGCEESNRKIKMMRRIYTANELNHLKFCVIKDKTIADELMIDTTKEGEIYMFSNYDISDDMTPFDLRGVTFFTSKIASEEQCSNRCDKSYFEEMLNFPIVLNNFIEYVNMSVKYKDNTLFIFYTPDEFQSIYNEVIQYRKKHKYTLEKDPIIVLCRSRATKAIEENDIPIDRSVCRYYSRLTNNCDSIQKFVNSIDNKTVTEWKKALIEGSPNSSQTSNKDSDKKSEELLNNPLIRFMVKETYQLEGEINAANIEKFIEDIKAKKQKVYYSEKLPQIEKHSMKVTTNDFEAAILEKPSSSLVLFYNKCNKSGKMALEEYEKVLGKFRCPDVKFYRMSTYSEVYE